MLYNFYDILSLPLIQDGQLSVSGERMGTSITLRTKPAHEKVWLGKLMALDMTPVGCLNINKQKWY